MFKQFILLYFKDYAPWLLIVYTSVLTAMLVDLICGVRKARLLGRKRTSRGYKQTCDKALKYFMPMICLTCIDLISSAVMPLPALTMAMGIYNIFCEFKSITETLRDKAEINRYASIIRFLLSRNDKFKELINEIYELTDKKKD